MNKQDVLTKKVRKSIEVSRDVPPRSRTELKKYLKEFADVRVPDRHVCGCHASPFDYLWYGYSRDAQYQKSKCKKQNYGSGFAAAKSTGSSAAGRAASLYSPPVGMTNNGDCIVWANRAGGKTQLAAVATLLEGVFKPYCQTRILAGSLAQSGRMFGYLRDFVESAFSDSLSGRMLKESCAFVNGAEVQILPQSSASVRGQHVHKLRCDEVELFEPDVFNAAKFITQSKDNLVAAMEMFSTMHKPYGHMQRLIDAAPDSGIPIFKWCVWEVIERCGSDRSCSRCPLDNDCQGKARRANGYLKIDDVISQMRRSSRAGFEAEMLCLRPHLENAVFGEFDPAVHVRPVTYDPNLPLYRAVDFGFVNPLVCLWIQPDADGMVRVIDEYVQNRRTAAANADAIIARTPGRAPERAMTFCDPAGAQKNGVTGTSEIKVFKDKGMPCKYKKSGILEGIEKIRAALRNGNGLSRLMIHPDCVRLIEALRCYHYPESDVLTELPDKDGTYDHPIDALRYFFVNAGKMFHSCPKKY
ncbi:MAG: phage terminase large subunit family protein [Planctomycetota bacterium]|jgi:hypothetical protein